MFPCVFCDKHFSRKARLKRHLRESRCSFNGMVESEASSSSTISRKRKADQTGGKQRSIKCICCNVDVPSLKYSSHLKSIFHKNKSARSLYGLEEEEVEGVEEVTSAFRGRIVTYRVRAINATSETKLNVELYINAVREKILQLISNKLEEYGTLKINFELFATFVKPAAAVQWDEDDGEQIVSDIKSFSMKYRVITLTTDLNAVVDDVVAVCQRKIDEFQVCFSKNMRILY